MDTKQRKGRGGRRPGAGRPARGDKLIRITLGLTQQQHAQVKSMARQQGINAAEALRLLVQDAAAAGGKRLAPGGKGWRLRGSFDVELQPDEDEE